MIRKLKAAAKARLYDKGLAVLPRRHQHVLFGAPCISGSFAPKEQNSLVGSRTNYFIHEGYHHRTEPTHFDDTANADEWQLEVYQFAREICDQRGFNTVCDFGCGSGYKLMKYFRDLTTVGIEVPSTRAYLRTRWPDREWLDWDAATRPAVQVDMAIAADVIEHLAEPNALMERMAHLRPKALVISTPDRNLVRSGTHNGPPSNAAHVREWSFPEFQAYVSDFFTVEEHFISCAAQATQCVLCHLNKQTSGQYLSDRQRGNPQ
jgi:hypothetical protein